MNKGIFKIKDINSASEYTDKTEALNIMLTLQENDFLMQSEKVQGAFIGKAEILNTDFMYVNSFKRFKLYTEDTNIVYILSGDGFIKYNRGEINFTKNDLIVFCGVKEYELNGKCQFILLK